MLSALTTFGPLHTSDVPAQCLVAELGCVCAHVFSLSTCQSVQLTSTRALAPLLRLLRSLQMPHAHMMTPQAPMGYVEGMDPSMAAAYAFYSNPHPQMPMPPPVCRAVSWCCARCCCICC